MEKSYWLRRKRAAMAAARGAATAELRLLQYARAGRYSVRAAQAPEADRDPPAPGAAR